MGPDPHDWCPYKKRLGRDTDTQGEGHVRMEAETGEMLLQAKNSKIAGQHQKLQKECASVDAVTSDF